MPSSKSAGAPSGYHRRRPSKEPDDDEAPTNTLWVGNLSSDIVDADLMGLFAEHGALDCTTMHCPRTYAYVYFKHVDDAKAAKAALQGTRLHGSPIKTEFARPAKACKQLWIGGISSSTTKELLEDEFLKFGKIAEYNFLRDRNSALINYYKTEDAVAAQKNMNGKRLVGEQIRVDFMRPQPYRRDGPDHHDSRDGHFSRNMGPPEPWMPGPNRHPPYGGQRDGPPSTVLWVGYPPSVHVDEQMLHNAMILFGEIERIRCIPSRHYSFVEFRSIDEARRAKEGLQGRLFNDPRIQILFSSSELAPHKDDLPPFPGLRGPRPEIFFNEAPFGPLELFGPVRPMPQNNFPGLLPMPGPNVQLRPFAQGIDPRHGSSEFHEFGGAMHDFPDGDPNNPMPPNWRRQTSSVPGMHPSAPDMQPPFRPMLGGWDGFDMREPKRSRFDGSPTNDPHFHARRMDDESIRDPFRFPHPDDRGASGPSQHNRAVQGHGQMHGSSDHDHFWRGIIAKGGTHVCHARCVPIGQRISAPFPGTINCSGRAELDMLTTYYAEAIGFDIVFFLPDSEEDFAPYTEFLRYLGQKNRAGVAKLDDGTTIFLVPPSDFLSKVLNVPGPERLYGVVLKQPEQSTSSATQQPQPVIPPPPSHYMDRQQVSESQRGYNFVPQYEEQTFRTDYNRYLHEVSMPPVGVENPQLAQQPQLAHDVESYTRQPSSQDYVSQPAATSQVEISLTPELLATLASLIPSNIQPGATGTIQIPLSSSMRSGSSLMQDGSMPSQGWRQEHQVTVPGVSLEQPRHLPQQLGYQYNNQAPYISQFPTYTNIRSEPDHSAQPALESAQIQNPSLNMPQETIVPTQPLNNYVIPSQVGQFSVPQSNQQYQLGSSYTAHNNYGMLQTADAAGVYTPPVQHLNPNTSTTHVQAESLSQPPQTVVPLPTNPPNMGFSTQGQQLQTVFSSSDQGTSEGDADKNQRYQSTLQFAASLLQQLQQQQQTSSQAVQGSGNQQ